jgi:hypothetical protein
MHDMLLRSFPEFLQPSGDVDGDSFVPFFMTDSFLSADIYSGISKNV